MGMPLSSTKIDSIPLLYHIVWRILEDLHSSDGEKTSNNETLFCYRRSFALCLGLKTEWKWKVSYSKKQTNQA